MLQLTQVTHLKVGCGGDKDLIPGKKFSHKSQRGTSYGDALMEIDWAVGQILEYVTKKKRLDRNSKTSSSAYLVHFSTRQTLVIFTSDNGAALVSKEKAGKVSNHISDEL